MFKDRFFKPTIYPLFSKSLPIVKRTVDMSISIKPKINEPIAIRVVGIENILVSLKNEIIIIVKNIPMKSKIRPGIPRIDNGCLIVILSKREPMTSEE